MDSTLAGREHALRAARLLLEAYSGVELPEWDFFSQQVEIENLPSGTTLVDIGDTDPRVYFVQNGLLRVQAPDASGRLSTVFFSEEGDVMASMASLGGRSLQRVADRRVHPRSQVVRESLEPTSMHRVVCLEDSLLVAAHYQVIDDLTDRHPEWAKLVSNLSLMYAATLQYDLAWLRAPAETRYRRLLEVHPSLVQRVTQRDLAGFLNVTEASLSRIAKRVRNDGSLDEVTI